MDWLVIILSAPSVLLGVASLWGVWRSIRDLDQLSDVEYSQRSAWPKISIVSPACDEEESLRESLESALNCHYPSLEIIAVNDRSTDGTPEIIDTLAAQDKRLRAVHIAVLREGWLGKLNAMEQGVAAASGDWILFADADVIFAEHALHKAIAYAELNQLDYLTVLPEIVPTNFLTDSVFNISATGVLLGSRAWQVREPNNRAILGTGAFLLLRRSAYDAGPGLEWMRLEVADDQVICALIKLHGGRCDVVNGSKEISLEWYRSLGEMNRMMQKGFFACVAHFSLIRGILISLALTYAALFPMLALVPGIGGWAWLPIGALIALMVTNVAVSIWSKRPVLPALFPGIGLLLLAGMIIRASVVGHRQGGITWRGVFYPSVLLDKHQRYGRRPS